MYLEPHATIRKANKISLSAKFDHLEIEDSTRDGFFVHYDNSESFRGTLLVFCARTGTEDFKEVISGERARLAFTDFVPRSFTAAATDAHHGG